MLDVGNYPAVMVRVTEFKKAVKIVWTAGGDSFRPYNISLQMLNNQAKHVRDALNALVAQALKNGCGECGTQLRALAVAGARLRDALFLPVESDEISPWLDSLLPEHRLCFVVDSDIHVPWGLIYSGDGAAFPVDSLTAEITACNDFWALRHHLSIVHERIEPARDKLLGAEFKLLPIIDEIVHTTAHKTLAASGDDKFDNDVNAEFLQDPVRTIADIRTRFSTIANNDGLLYFLGHADEKSISLNFEQLLLGDIMLALGRRSPRILIAFINGCVTATGDPEGGWLDAMSANGCVGFIGTEAPVPDVFALRFGHDFLNSFLTQRQTILATMDDLRRRHLPLSLLYSTNCWSTLQIDPAMLDTPFEPRPDNLSLKKLGTGTI